MSIALDQIVVAVICFAVGLVGFAQVLWSMKKVKQRGWGLTLGTSIVWTLILYGAGWLVIRFFPGQLGSLAVGYAVAFFILFVAQVKK